MATSSVNQDETAPLLNRFSRESQPRYFDIETRLSQKKVGPIYGQLIVENSWKSHLHNAYASWSGKFGSQWGRKICSDCPRGSMSPDDFSCFDQFKSTDWVHDSITDATRDRNIFCRRDIRGRLLKLLCGLDTWILTAFIGSLVATAAYGVTIAEANLFDLKRGYCSNRIFVSYKDCCLEGASCDNWKTWSTIIHPPFLSNISVEYFVFIWLMIIFSMLACLLTLTTKIKLPTICQLTSIENDFGVSVQSGISEDLSIENHISSDLMTYNTIYPVAGSGFAETRVILNGFLIRGFLGLQVMLVKFLALALSISSGLNIGKEGPVVHIAACMGNIVCRSISHFIGKGEKYRDILSAAAAAGVAVTFGAPIGGVIFGLEEFSSLYRPKTVLRAFLCSTTATLTLKFLNPYGNGKISLLDASYHAGWQSFELVTFIIVGFLGGAYGALFVKAARTWDQSFRPHFKEWPLLEVFTITVLTGIVSFWNPLTKISSRDLLDNLVSPCSLNSMDEYGLCPQDLDSNESIILNLSSALAVKGLLMVVTFGIKIPAGIYIPSMVLGGLGGRIFGHLIQSIPLRYPSSKLLVNCNVNDLSQNCFSPGLYGLIAAGSTMCGVTRLSLATVIILLEMTGSIEYVIPFSLAILCAKWTAGLLESQSIYDYLIEKNSYPFLSNDHDPGIESQLVAMLAPVKHENLIDITSSPIVSVKILQSRLNILIRSWGVVGGIPIIRDEKVVGILLGPELKAALESLDDKSAYVRLANTFTSYAELDTNTFSRSIDFTPIIKSVYLSLDIKSPLALVHHCFVNLGVGYICILHEGRYAGMIYKRMFAHYTRKLSREK